MTTDTYDANTLAAAETERRGAQPAQGRHPAPPSQPAPVAFHDIPALIRELDSLRELRDSVLRPRVDDPVTMEEYLSEQAWLSERIPQEHRGSGPLTLALCREMSAIYALIRARRHIAHLTASLGLYKHNAAKLEPLRVAVERALEYMREDDDLAETLSSGIDDLAAALEEANKP